MHWQSTFDWALRLHSCRALSSQSHTNDKPKMVESKKILTNHIPAQLRVLQWFFYFANSERSLRQVWDKVPNAVTRGIH